MKWGTKCHQNISPVVCNDYVKYEEAEVDRLKTNNCAAAAEADRVENSKQPASARAAHALIDRC